MTPHVDLVIDLNTMDDTLPTASSWSAAQVPRRATCRSRSAFWSAEDTRA